MLILPIRAFSPRELYGLSVVDFKKKETERLSHPKGVTGTPGPCPSYTPGLVKAMDYCPYNVYLYLA